MSDATFNVLVLCTGNSARSILGEALVGKLGEGRFAGYSAGSTPKGQVHPAAIELLSERGFDTSGFRSKSWDEFTAPDAPRMDLVVTVCDNAAGEACPVWIGHPLQVHWGLDDPAAVEGEGQRAAFEKAYAELERRIARLVALPVREMDPAALREALEAIHREAEAA